MKEKLIEIKGSERKAIFKNLVDGHDHEVKFDALHVVPPQIAPAFIKKSGLADGSGFAEVDGFTLQHKKFANVWCLGDSAGLTCSKTAAAVFS